MDKKQPILRKHFHFSQNGESTKLHLRLSVINKATVFGNIPKYFKQFYITKVFNIERTTISYLYRACDIAS